MEDVEETISQEMNEARRPSSESVASKKALLQLSSYSNFISQSPLSVKSGCPNLESGSFNSNLNQATQAAAALSININSNTNNTNKESSKSVLSIGRVIPQQAPKLVLKDQKEKETLKKPKKSKENIKSASRSQELGFRYSYNFDVDKQRVVTQGDENKYK